MANGIVNMFKFVSFDPIEKPLNKIMKLWVKYDYQDSIIPVDNRFSIESTKNGKVIYIRANNERLIVANNNTLSGLAGSFITGATLGLVDLAPIRFVTTDTTVANRKFVDELTNALNRNLPKIEQQMKDASQKRWG